MQFTVGVVYGTHRTSPSRSDSSFSSSVLVYPFISYYIGNHYKLFSVFPTFSFHLLIMLDIEIIPITLKETRNRNKFFVYFIRIGTNELEISNVIVS